MVNDDFIRKHYQKVAKNFGDTGLSTIQDPIIRNAETQFFLKEIRRYKDRNSIKEEEMVIADLGCGNGFLLDEIRRHFPKVRLIGLEFTPELLDIAKERKIENCQFMQGDIREFSAADKSIDIIITERVIINLQSWKQQRSAFIHIHRALKKDGRYLMSESFNETWVQMNLARREVLLSDLPQSKHNKYISENAIKAIHNMGLVEIKGHTSQHYLSTHFYITRVLHPTIRPEGGKIKHSHLVHFLNLALEPGIGNYSPIQFRVFEKKKSIC